MTTIPATAEKLCASVDGHSGTVYSYSVLESTLLMAVHSTVYFVCAGYCVLTTLCIVYCLSCFVFCDNKHICNAVACLSCFLNAEHSQKALNVESTLNQR